MGNEALKLILWSELQTPFFYQICFRNRNFNGNFELDIPATAIIAVLEAMQIVHIDINEALLEKVIYNIYYIEYYIINYSL
jgi:hypothetical protein